GLHSCHGPSCLCADIGSLPASSRLGDQGCEPLNRARVLVRRTGEVGTLVVPPRIVLKPAVHTNGPAGGAVVLITLPVCRLQATPADRQRRSRPMQSRLPAGSA